MECSLMRRLLLGSLFTDQIICNPSTIKKAFFEHISLVTTNISRVDLFFDLYLINSLKSTARQKRGSSSAVRFRPSSVELELVFKSNSENKQAPFVFLAQKDASVVCHPYQDMNVTSNDTAHALHSTATTVDVSLLTPCNHEEADTRVFLHCKHSAINGLKSLMISTVHSC